MAVAPRRTTRRPWLALLLLSLLIGGLGWILYLRLTNQPLRGPFGWFEPAQVAPDQVPGDRSTKIRPPADGMVRALVPARDVRAYQKVTRDDLFDGRRGAFTYVDVDKEFAEKNGVLVGTSSIIGRVMGRPKRPGFVFTEADFLPEGTRPGLAAGIPPGKRAVRIDVALVRGIIGLNPGDRFDLVAATTIEAPVVIPESERDAAGASSALGIYADLVPRPSTKPPKQHQGKARVDVIVQGGSVVYPLETRLIPTSSASLTAGQITGTKPVQEMVIALAPEEVAPLMAALRMKADLTCVARSGRPEDAVDSVTPGLNQDLETADLSGDSGRRGVLGATSRKFDELAVVETVIGGQRTLTAIPRAVSALETNEPADDGGR